MLSAAKHPQFPGAACSAEVAGVWPPLRFFCEKTAEERKKRSPLRYWEFDLRFDS